LYIYVSLVSAADDVSLFFSQNNPDTKGLYGVSFPYYDELSMVYSKDMATCEGAEDMTDVVKNLEEELVCVNANDEEVGEDMTSVETPRRSVDSTSSSSKKQKEWKGMKTVSSDPLLDMFNEMSGDLNGIFLISLHYIGFQNKQYIGIKKYYKTQPSKTCNGIH
jgi:hypothetical protein